MPSGMDQNHRIHDDARRRARSLGCRHGSSMETGLDATIETVSSEIHAKAPFGSDKSSTTRAHVISADHHTHGRARLHQAPRAIRCSRRGLADHLERDGDTGERGTTRIRDRPRKLYRDLGDSGGESKSECGKNAQETMGFHGANLSRDGGVIAHEEYLAQTPDRASAPSSKLHRDATVASSMKRRVCGRLRRDSTSSRTMSITTIRGTLSPSTRENPQSNSP